MAHRYKDITINQGATFSANVVAYVNTSSSTVLSLSGYTANAQIKKSYYHGNTAAMFNVWIQDATAGIVNLVLDSANTVAMTDGKYVYDVMVTKSGVKTRIVEGIATVTPGVAR